VDRYRHSPIVGQSTSWKLWTKRGGDRVPDSKLEGIAGETTVHTLIRTPQYHLLLFSGPERCAADETTLQESASSFFESEDAVKVTAHIILSTPSKSEISYVDESGKVHKLFGFKEAGYALVRPDGHIEFIGLLKEMDQLKDWMKKSRE
jgi:hypothetical protein